MWDEAPAAERARRRDVPVPWVWPHAEGARARAAHRTLGRASGSSAASGERVAGRCARPRAPRSTRGRNGCAAAGTARARVRVGRAAARRNAGAAAPARAERTLAPVPIWARFLLWLVAVPLAFFVVFAVARGIGLFTSDQQSDVFLAKSVSRFWPVIRLLPFVALLCAGLVQSGVYALARWRGQRDAARGLSLNAGCNSRATSHSRAPASDDDSHT